MPRLVFAAPQSRCCPEHSAWCPVNAAANFPQNVRGPSLFSATGLRRRDRQSQRPRWRAIVLSIRRQKWSRFARLIRPSIPWTGIGAFGAPLADVAFGQFDPGRRDHRAGVTRRSTHAFRRLPGGQWQVTALSAPAWTNVQSSSFPMSRLRFGDFTGDGVTDVLGVNAGRWAISESARGRWRQLNSSLGDDVGTLFIADLKSQQHRRSPQAARERVADRSTGVPCGVHLVCLRGRALAVARTETLCVGSPSRPAGFEWPRVRRPLRRRTRRRRPRYGA